MNSDGRNFLTKVGKKLRYLRKQGDWTLKQLAKETDLSIGYLSNLERDITSPTLDNIQRICGTLGISLQELLDEDTEEKTVIKKEERKIIFEREDSICYESIHFGEDRLEGLCITVGPHTKYDTTNWIHNYDEIGLILEGSMVIRIEETYHTLNEGDAFFIKANTNHSFSNESANRCISYWVRDPKS